MVVSLLVAVPIHELPHHRESNGGAWVVVGVASTHVHFRGLSLAWRRGGCFWLVDFLVVVDFVVFL